LEEFSLVALHLWHFCGPGEKGDYRKKATVSQFFRCGNETGWVAVFVVRTMASW